MDRAGQEHWENRYSGEDYWYGTSPNAFLAASRSQLPASGRALAVADGEGRNGVFLAECGLDVISLDYSAKAQAKAQALAGARGVALRTEHADLLGWNWPEAAFDVVAGIFVQFLEPAARAEVFGRMRRALKPGGLLVLQGFSTAQIGLGSGGPGKRENLYTRQLLVDSFGDFADLAIVEEEAELAEGAGHCGLAALIGLVGRRP